MWIFTELADWFDKQRLANAKFLDQTFTGWVDYALAHSNDEGFFSAIRNVEIYNIAGAAYATNTLSTTVASGFVDTLRIGDGVKKGGWGYGQDALRFLVVAAPLFRAGRLGLAAVASMDAADTAPICSWVGSAQALRLTGVRHFATVEQLANASGLAASNFGEASKLGARFLSDLLTELTALGADAKTAGAAMDPAQPVEAQLLDLLNKNPNAVAPFSVFWRWTGSAVRGASQFSGNKTVGHTMVAFRSATGGLRILDRSGKIARSLAELDALLPDGRYGGIGAATFYAREDTALLIQNSSIITLLESGALIQAIGEPLLGDDGILFSDASWLRQALGLEVRSVPFRVEMSRPARPPVPVAPSASGGPIPTQTVCVPMTNGLEGGGQICAGATYVLRQGDTLWTIAIRAYGDGLRWRDIAEANGVRDPENVPVGTILVLPPT